MVLNISDPRTVKAMRKVMIDWGYKGQRLGATLLSRWGRAQF